MSPANETNSLSVRLVAGLLIVGFGLALMLDNLEVIEVGNLLRFWPFALILVGLVKLLQDQTQNGRVAGGILVVVGTLFAVDTFFFLRYDVWRWWPLAIVIFGILIMLKAFRREEAAMPPAGGLQSGLPGAVPSAAPNAMPSAVPASSTVQTTMDQKVEDWAIWSGIERRVASPAFKRADLVAVMGGIEFDLRQAGTDQGEAVIEVFVLWGGIEIKVPPDWAVSNDITVIIGGAEDKSTGTQQARNRLIVKGVVIMGGVDIST